MVVTFAVVCSGNQSVDYVARILGGNVLPNISQYFPRLEVVPFLS